MGKETLHRMETKDIYSNIPMRTWRWLGVNEIKTPAKIGDGIKKQEIIVQDGQEDEVVLEHRNGGQHETVVHVGKNAKLHLVLAQLVPTDKPYTSRVTVDVADGGAFSYTGAEVGASTLASELTVNLSGKESTADVWSLYFGDGDRLLDLNYIIRQAGKKTDANMQVRGTLMGTSTKNFRGTLDFLEGGKGSVGRENEEVMLLDEGVRNRSVPIMLSHEDDVDGHHAVAVGRMDEAKLFYLMSRGLDMEEAKSLVVEASLRPVIDRIPDEKLRDEIDQYLKGRLANG